MTTQEKYSLAKWAMQQALQMGAQEVSVQLSGSISNGIEVREKKIDRLEQAREMSLTIRLFVDKKYSACSTNRLNKEELKRFIQDAIETTRFLAPDEYRTLPDPSLYYKGNGPDLKLTDPGFSKIEPQKKIEIAYALENEALGKDPRIISVSASYSDGLTERILVTSNGFEGDQSNSYFGVSASVSLHAGEARPEAGWGENSVHFDKLIKNGSGEKALDRVLKKVGQEKIASARMPMLVDNRSISRLFSPIMGALSGSAIQQKNSFLIDKLDQKLFSDKLTVTDDPFIPGAAASRLFDGEGLATKRRNIFEAGVLKTYYIDTYYAKKLKMNPTSGNTNNVIFKTGERNLEEMIANLQRGMLVTGFNGGNCNATTGDFSYGIEGFLIENGKIVKPISEMNITGNMIKLWSDIAEIGNDPRENTSWRIPSICFNNMDFSGS